MPNPFSCFHPSHHETLPRRAVNRATSPASAAQASPPPPPPLTGLLAKADEGHIGPTAEPSRVEHVKVARDNRAEDNQPNAKTASSSSSSTTNLLRKVVTSPSTRRRGVPASSESVPLGRRLSKDMIGHPTGFEHVRGAGTGLPSLAHDQDRFNPTTLNEVTAPRPLDDQTNAAKQSSNPSPRVPRPPPRKPAPPVTPSVIKQAGADVVARTGAVAPLRQVAPRDDPVQDTAERSHTSGPSEYPALLKALFRQDSDPAVPDNVDAHRPSQERPSPSNGSMPCTGQDVSEAPECKPARAPGEYLTATGKIRFENGIKAIERALHEEGEN